MIKLAQTHPPFGHPPLTGRASLFVLFMFLATCFMLPNPVHAATFSFSPSSGSYGNGCQSSVDIRLDASGQSTNAADIIIDYDPSLVEIIDSDTGTTGVQITPGSVYTNFFGNVVDTNAGVIRLTGASFTSFFTSAGVFGSIQFRPRTSSGTANFQIRFTGANPYNSLDSNIADSATSNDLLSSVTNGSYTLTSQSCVSDSTPPTITHVSPTNGQTGIPSGANIVTTISDTGSGVDQNSVEIIINGVTYKAGQTGVIVTGNSSSYTFTVTPTTLLFTNQLNTVVVNARDFNGNSKSSTITFNAPTPTGYPSPSPTYGPTPTPTISIAPGTCPTPAPCPTCSSNATCPNISPTPSPIDNIKDDHKTPYIEFVKPKAKDTIDLTPTFVFKVSDFDSGIDLDSLKIIFNDQIYNRNSATLTYKGDAHSYEITLQTKEKLSDSSEYSFEVFIADLNQNGLSQTINLKTKTPILNQIGNIFKNNLIISPSQTNVTIAQIAKGFSSIFFLSLLPFLLFLLYHFLRRQVIDKNTPYGIVFNSATHEPIYQAKITVFNHENKKMATYFTNIFGIFAGSLPPGKYRFLVEKKSYAFPSETDFKTLDYPHLYHGEIVEVTKNPNVYLNIPLDQKEPVIENKLLPKYGITSPNITLGLKETKFDALVTTRVTDNLGRYRFIVPHGRYQLTYKNKPVGNIIDTRHRIDGYTVINKDLKI